MRSLAIALSFLAAALAASSTANAAEHRGTCWITELASFENRVHIRCLPAPSPGSLSSHPGSSLPDPGVLYLAVDTTKMGYFADRVIAIAQTAIQMKAYVAVVYDSDIADNPPGCLATDCRKLVAVTLSN